MDDSTVADRGVNGTQHNVDVGQLRVDRDGKNWFGWGCSCNQVGRLGTRIGDRRDIGGSGGSRV